jgi:hypothetical protein
MVKEFKMKEGEVWCCDLAGKNTKDRPKWNDKSCWMCMRWFSKGDCFTNCNNKDCHVGAADIPTNKKAKHISFLKRVQGNPKCLNVSL